MKYKFLFFLTAAALMSSCAADKATDNGHHTDDVDTVVPVEVPKSQIPLAGTWTSKDNGLYPVLEFKGKSTVILNTILGSFATSYERDEEFVRLRTDQSDLLFEVVSNDSIVGFGFAKGIWVRNK